MSRNNSFPPIQKRASNVAASDMSGEMTIDQFLSKYSQLSVPKKEDHYVRRTPSPMAAARAASNIRRTSIRRPPSSKTGVGADQSAEEPPLSRSEQALLLTERSAVLLDPADSEETMSNGDSARSTDRSHWHTKFLQSPSPDNRRGDKPPPPRRKSLLERWEEVQATRPGPPSAGGSSTDSQFEDDAYPYHPRINTRGSSQETGFEPTPGDEAAQRPPSGVDSLATPRSGRRPPSSASTASARSDPSDLAPAGRSLFDSGNVETVDDVIDSLLSSRTVQTAKSRRRAGSRGDDSHWDQVDRSSHPVIETVRFPELVKAISPPADEDQRDSGGGLPRPATSATQVLERLSQVMSTQRTQRSAAPHTAPQGRDDGPVREGLEETVSQRPPSGRAPAVLRSPRARPLTSHRAPPAAPLTATFTPHRAGQPGTAAAGWHSHGPPKPPRLAARRSTEPSTAISSDHEGAPEAAAAVWLEPGLAGRHPAELEQPPEGDGERTVTKAASPELDRPPREAFCAVSPVWTAAGSRSVPTPYRL